MKLFSRINAGLSRWTMYLACTCLVGLLSVVIYGVVLRYVFNDAPPYVEQVALLLVVSVAMFGASAGVRDAGHIGLDSLVKVLPAKLQLACALVVHVLIISFAVALLIGGGLMAVSTHASTIPTLGLSEAVRYVPVLMSGLLITAFSIEHLIALVRGTKVIPSWH